MKQVFFGRVAIYLPTTWREVAEWIFVAMAILELIRGGPNALDWMQLAWLSVIVSALEGKA